MSRLGVHLGLGEGYDKALAHAKALACATVQIFTHSPRSFQFKEIDGAKVAALREGWKALGISPVVSHCCYLINLGSSDNKAFHGSLATTRKELEYAAAFGCQHFVLHVGKYTTTDCETGMRQVARGIDKLADTLKATGVTLLLETVAGQGTEIGKTFEELAQLIAMVGEEARAHIGVCVDTCHIFAAGYDLAKADEVVRKLDATIGMDRVKLIHVNDSKFGLGERKDRHEHVGRGMIGKAALRAFLTHPRIRDLPMVLETPVDDDGDQASDMAALREIVG